MPDEIAPDAAVTQEPDDSVIVFSDAVLEAFIREARGKPEGDIAISDAQTLTELELSQMGVDQDQPYTHSLDALQYFTNLTYLGLGYAVQNASDPTAPIDISPLAGLSNLGYLDLEGNEISEVAPLAG